MTQKRILLVEDEFIIAMSLEMELKRAGYIVCQLLAKGEDAVQSVQQEAPDCILMDIRLAGKIDGIEAAQQIQEFANIPIIFVTGYPDSTVEERARKLNPLGFFVKPVQISLLQPLIDSIQKDY